MTTAPLPETNSFQFDFQISRILNRHVADVRAHGPIDPEKAVESMFAYVDSDLTLWDLADTTALPRTSSEISGNVDPAKWRPAMTASQLQTIRRAIPLRIAGLR